MTQHGTLRALRARWDNADTWDRKAELLEVGATFASVSMRTPTDKAEGILADWLKSGKPDTFAALDADQSGMYLSARDARLEAVRWFVSDYTRIAALEALDSFDREAFFAAECRDWMASVGYEFYRGIVPFGVAKSAFALACAGLGDVGCIDSRILKARNDDLVLFCTASGPKWYQTWRKRTDRDRMYKEATQYLWGETDTADGQWCEWDETGKAHRVLLGF